jgi:hypothetical protein
MGFWSHAFHVERAADFVATPSEQALLDGAAGQICRRGLAVPAILFLEMLRPLNFVGSQAMAFFAPVVRAVFDWRRYDEFQRLLARRGSVEALLTAIENAEAAREWNSKHRGHSG